MRVIPRPVQYLLRFDDLCPTMLPAGWEECRRLVEEFGVRPILAVVPDNEDRDLVYAPADTSFWTRVKEMEAGGAAVAVHGYKHLCNSRGRSLLGLHRNSEFAGVDLDVQREWIRTGIAILRQHGLHPRLWVAPRHGFDRDTLRALREVGIEYLSDGFGRGPHLRGGVTWIPQQLWSPMEKSAGLWTICIHPNAASVAEWQRLRWFLGRRAEQFTSFDRVVKELSGERMGWRERVYETIALWRVQMRHRRREKNY